MTEIVLNVLEKLINRYIKLDPESTNQLANLANHILKVELLGVGIIFYIKVAPDRLCFLAEYNDPVDAIIRATPIALAELWQGQRKGQTKFDDKVEISGDPQWVQKLSLFMQSIDIDWEEQLAKICGDFAAHKIGTLVRHVKSYGDHIKDTFTLNLSEYLQEELRVLPPKAELENFFADVDELRNDIERTELRLQRLESMSGNINEKN